MRSPTVHFVPHQYIWNIWTGIRWEAKLKKSIWNIWTLIKWGAKLAKLKGTPSMGLNLWCNGMVNGFNHDTITMHWSQWFSKLLYFSLISMKYVWAVKMIISSKEDAQHYLGRRALRQKIPRNQRAREHRANMKSFKPGPRVQPSSPLQCLHTTTTQVESITKYWSKGFSNG